MSCNAIHEIVNLGQTREHLSLCMNRCSENKECEYLFYNSESKCILFDKCDNVQDFVDPTSSGSVVTFQKQRGKEFLVSM